MKNFLSLILFVLLIIPFLKSQDVNKIVDEINQQKSTTLTFGSSSQFNGATIDEVNAVALSETKFIVAYRYWSNSVTPEYYGYARVGEISGTTISWGNVVSFNLAQTQSISIDAIDEDKIVIVYEDISNSLYGTARIASVSGNTISLGDEYIFEESQTGTTTVKFLSSDKFVVAYNNGSNVGVSCIGSISDGTTITFGASDQFNSGGTLYTKLVVLGSNKVAIA